MFVLQELEGIDLDVFKLMATTGNINRLSRGDIMVHCNMLGDSVIEEHVSKSINKLINMGLLRQESGYITATKQGLDMYLRIKDSIEVPDGEKRVIHALRNAAAQRIASTAYENLTSNQKEIVDNIAQGNFELIMGLNKGVYGAVSSVEEEKYEEDPLNNVF